MRRFVVALAVLVMGAFTPWTSATAQRQLGATVTQTDNGVHTHVGRRVTWVCPAIAESRLADAAIWGSDVYSSDSHVCLAAIHAGVLKVGSPGIITIVIAAGADAFTASTRNGVTTKAYGAWGSSFFFDKTGEPGQLDWTTTGTGIPPAFTDSVPVMCPGGGAASLQIWGTDVYHADSPICLAAVHAGVITRANGGRFRVTRVPGQQTYAASDRNGVKSTAWSTDSGGFRVSGTTTLIATAMPPAPIPGTVAPVVPVVTPPIAPEPVAPPDRPATTTNPALDQGLLVGTGISDITGPIAEVVMMGFAEAEQKTAGLHTRLYARAFIFANKTSGKRVVWVNTELAMLFSSVKQGVLKKLAAKYGTMYTDANVMLSATHTHAGPGGYSHHTIYNISIGGFVKQNYNAIVDGITEAIVQAHDRLKPGSVSMMSHDVIEPTMVQRSKAAFMLNQDVLAKPSTEEINRDMTLLKIVSAGTPVGVIAFHAVHNTSMPKSNRLVSSDHKGYAAHLFERTFGSIAPFQSYGAFVAAFPNGAEGDMSPNLNTSAKTVFYGPDPNSMVSSQIIGTRQFNAAYGLFNGVQQTDLGTEVDYRHKFVLMPGTVVPSSDYTNGVDLKTLCTGAYGMSFMAGAEDGPTGNLSEGIALKSDFDAATLDAAKVVVVGIFGALMPAIMPVLGPLAPAGAAAGGTATAAAAAMVTATNDKCQFPKPILLPTGFMHWSPEILPFQILRIGSVAIIGVPAEMTMQAGRRLEAAVRAVMLPLGVQRVLITGLANEYSGYVTTPEEYVSQQYEGASTLFGKLTFDAYREAFQDLGVSMATGKPAGSGPPIPDVGAAQIEWAPTVDHDEVPIGQSFGQFLLQPPPTVARGTTVRTIHRSGTPRNDLRRNDSYVKIERDIGGGQWKLEAWDNMPETVLQWARDANCPDPKKCYWSTMDVFWAVPAAATAGTYRMRVFGAWKNGRTKAITKYERTSLSFTVQ